MKTNNQLVAQARLTKCDGNNVGRYCITIMKYWAGNNDSSTIEL